jgi:hypothetical protein
VARLGPTSGSVSSSRADRRRTPHYDLKREDLPAHLRLELDLVEERILSEGEHPLRYLGPDGITYDLLSFREKGIAVSYRVAIDGNHLFVDFVIAR